MIVNIDVYILEAVVALDAICVEHGWLCLYTA